MRYFSQNAIPSRAKTGIKTGTKTGTKTRIQTRLFASPSYTSPTTHLNCWDERTRGGRSPAFRKKPKKNSRASGIIFPCLGKEISYQNGKSASERNMEKISNASPPCPVANSRGSKFFFPNP